MDTSIPPRRLTVRSDGSEESILLFSSLTKGQQVVYSTDAIVHEVQLDGTDVIVTVVIPWDGGVKIAPGTM